MMSESFGKFIIIAELGKKEASAKNVTANASDILEVLQDLYMDECKQQEVYENYRYLLLGPHGIGVKEHLEEHMNEEQSHKDVLQRYIVSMDHVPTINRHAIPIPDAYNLKSLIRLNLKLETEAVEKYSIAIKAVEEIGNVLHAALLNDLQDIVSQETGHMQDLARWLKEEL